MRSLQLRERTGIPHHSGTVSRMRGPKSVMPLSIPSLIQCSVQFSRSVVSALCSPMNRSTPGLPVHHQGLEFTQTHVHRVSDAIPPSHPLSSPSPPSIRVFSNESTLPIRWPKYWSFSSASVLPMNTQDWSPLGWTAWISLQSKGLSFLDSPTLTYIHDYWKNHSFD